MQKKKRHFKFSQVNYMEMGQLHNKTNNSNKKEKSSLSGCDTKCQSDKS